MSRPNPRLEPFVGYRVTLAPEALAPGQARLVSQHPALRALVSGQRSVMLAPLEAATLYESIEPVPDSLARAFPLRFTPVRYSACRLCRAAPHAQPQRATSTR